ncbi:hypothetical protein SADUNF_Sadunf16G0183500 [Salix dunnii]|uniref:Uncharacterized protein n=1 Tax=Salix dunnii TaxID=1413687 RepID=A0A835JAM3_9ROSI|nr:hypothetical protein SADUNF_Sadunf16G0183500 [Salix dunnii]
MEGEAEEMKRKTKDMGKMAKKACCKPAYDTDIEGPEDQPATSFTWVETIMNLGTFFKAIPFYLLNLASGTPLLKIKEHRREKDVCKLCEDLESYLSVAGLLY